MTKVAIGRAKVQRFFSTFGVALFVFAVLSFLIAPLIVVLPLSVSSSEYLSYPMPGVSLRWYRAVMDSDLWKTSFRNSFVIAVGATAIATPLGTLCAYGLTMTNFRGKALLYGIVIAPLAVPTVVFSLAIYFLFARVGLLNSFSGLILAHAALGAPFVVIIVTATLSRFDRGLVRAASSLGAGPATAFLTVTLPLILPGVIAGAIFVFLSSWDEIIVALFIAGPEQVTLPKRLYLGLRDHYDPSIVAVAAILVFISTTFLAVFESLRWLSSRALRPTPVMNPELDIKIPVPSR